MEGSGSFCAWIILWIGVEADIIAIKGNESPT
ncbi:uncharacterized protein METZ01_LOCUS123694, partial [marine metagenome]